MNECGTKTPQRSKTNWLVNLPLFLLAIFVTLTDALHDPAIAAVNPFSPSTMKWIFFTLAIIGFYLRNFQTKKEISFSQQGPKELTSGPADVILTTNGMSSQKPKEFGGDNGPGA